MNQKKFPKIIPFLTVCIWGSMYIASGIVLKKMPALLLLLFRFATSSILLFAIGGRKFVRIEKKDWKWMLLIGFLGYFLSNAALLLGIQYSSGSFSSLINAMNPVLITIFAVWILKEHVGLPQIIALVISIIGAVIVIGAPAEAPSGFGIFCCLFSLVLWSFVTIFIKKMSAKYPALEVTAICMGIAAVFSLPSAFAFIRITHTAVTLTWDLLLPTAYICIVCTALSHFLWNASLGHLGASCCAAFYPMQPIVSVLLGILLLHEKITLPFLVGMLLIILSMFIHSDRIPLPKMKEIKKA